jgi:hypothetical protein
MPQTTQDGCAKYKACLYSNYDIQGKKIRYFFVISCAMKR